MIRRNGLLALQTVLLLTSAIVAATQYTWRQFNLQGMGFVTGIVAHPTEPDLIYARTDVGGIYRWNRSDESWIPLNDNKGTGYSIESFAIAPTDPNLLYAAIGHGDTGYVWESTDRGNRWSRTGLSVAMAGNGPWRYCGERLAVDPYNSSYLYYASLDSGLWKSEDAGDSWSRVSPSSLPVGIEGGQSFVVCDPSSGSAQTPCTRLYAGVHGSGVYRSNNRGESWQLVDGGPSKARKSVRGAITSDGKLFVTYAEKSKGGPGALYTCGPSSSLSDITPPDESEYGFVGIDAIGARIITFKWNAGPNKPMHYSTDGGASWRGLDFSNGGLHYGGEANVEEPPYYPTWSSWTNAGQIMLDPHHPDRAWVTTGFGVYRTDDLSDSRPQWRAIMRNLEELVPTIIKNPPAGDSSNIILGCMDMLGFVISDPGEVPQSRLEPQIMGIMTGLDYCEKYPHFMVMIGSGQHDWWDHRCGISHDNGATWDSLPTFPPNSHNGAIAVSAADTNRWVWAPENDWWDPVHLPKYTTDGGRTWRECSGMPEKFNGTSHMWAANQFVCADRVNPKLFYYFTHYNGNRWDGFLYRSTDGGAHFSLASEDLEAGGTVKIEAVPGAEGHLFASHVGGTALYFSDDSGSSFSKVAGFTGCDAFGFGAPVADSARPAVFAAATRAGRRSIYRSLDYGQTWEDIGLPTLPIDRITVMEGDRNRPGRVFFGASGRGFFYGDESTPAPLVPRKTVSRARGRAAAPGQWDLLGRRIGHGNARLRSRGVIVRPTGVELAPGVYR